MSVFVTTIAFTHFHFEDFARIPTVRDVEGVVPLFFGLLTFACLRRWNGSLVGLIIAHVLHNGIVVRFAPPYFPVAG